MGRLTNLVLIAAAVVLIAVGVAAQTGTISLGRLGGQADHQHRAVSGQLTVASPHRLPSPSPLPAPAPATSQAAQPAESQHGGGGGDEGGDGDGGD